MVVRCAALMYLLVAAKPAGKARSVVLQRRGRVTAIPAFLSHSQTRSIFSLDGTQYVDNALKSPVMATAF